MKKYKVLEDYKKEYGHIPVESTRLLSYLMSTMDISKIKKNILLEANRIANIHWSTFHFTIFMLPKASPRPRYSSKGHMFYVKGASDNKKIFQEAMKDSDFPIINTPMKFCCTSYLPIPNTMKKHEKILAEMGLIRPISKPDFDNLAKTYSDMIQGTVMTDDALIVEGISKKYYSCKPRIEIIIEYMDEIDSDYNKKKTER